jgi:hypothetical protein
MSSSSLDFDAAAFLALILGFTVDPSFLADFEGVPLGAFGVDSLSFPTFTTPSDFLGVFAD